MTATLADHLWQSSWCALAIWIWLRLWRGGFASVRHGFLLIASAKFLLPLAVLYAWGTRVGYPVPHAEFMPPADIVAAVNATHPVFWPISYLPLPGGALWTWLAAAWGAGALYCALRWFSSWRMSRLAVRLAAAFPPDLAFDSALETRICAAVTAPSVVGAFRPVLLLPAGAESKLDGAQLAAVFAYAKEYARRRYYAKAQLQRLVETLCWFHPLVWWIGRQLPREAARACDQAIVASGFDAQAYADGILASARLYHPVDVDWVLRGAQLPGLPPRPLGFFRGAAVAACAWIVLAQALFAGAVHDRLHRHAVMLADERTLSEARLELTLSAPGMGSRSVVVPRADGVLIRNVNLKELLALAYGVNRYNIIGSQMITSTSGIPEDHWLYAPRWDVRVTAKLHEPGIFDTYALHEAVTRMLVGQFGFEINVNGRCQDPCGRFAPALPEAQAGSEAAAAASE